MTTASAFRPGMWPIVVAEAGRGWSSSCRGGRHGRGDTGLQRSACACLRAGWSPFISGMQRSVVKEFARIYLDTAEDTDFEVLGVDAQWLCLRVLVPELSLSYAGVAD